MGALITEEIKYFEKEKWIRLYLGGIEALLSEHELKVYVTEFSEVKVSICF